ncbi:hypothetical protein L1987_70805 [Smallanthus sonchifolius]|uniref:Uncharacterized protein n=1 Tax=Smallanthus sonchifolius TaxID=185202 RepID=A0ACB9ARI7_9ASTR|nr:hypothetical protein L1987_70805 [Smallanthus sonchifolius]
MIPSCWLCFDDSEFRVLLWFLIDLLSPSLWIGISRFVAQLGNRFANRSNITNTRADKSLGHISPPNQQISAPISSKILHCCSSSSGTLKLL